MPTLDWIGKDKVVNHHLDVPYRVLERKYSFDEKGQHAEDNGSENMIIHGDNLEALKSLLPKYEGKVKCIYIDPPYNTGNEGWIYNDNVNDPKIKKWLGEVVGQEGEDLTRHDKWLCMMYPRLKLLQKLLSDDGAIFISIDDNEQANLKLICDEIFGAQNFVGTIAWESKTKCQNTGTARRQLQRKWEYIIVYKKKVARYEFILKDVCEREYPETDEKGPFRKERVGEMSLSGIRGRKTMVFPILDVYPKEGNQWKLGEESIKELIERGDILKENGRVCIKIRPNDEEKKQQPFWSLLFKSIGTGETAKAELKNIIGTSEFETVKPNELIKELIYHVCEPNENAIILDSFAGSGTTSHAVLSLNKEDGGNRSFIIIEMMNYAETLTAERVKKVIQGYGDGKNKVEGTGGSFSYYELGEPLMVGEYLNEEVSVDKIREYIYYTETKTNILPAKSDEPYFMGVFAGTAYYFNYEKGSSTTLSHSFLSQIKTKAESYVIYADLCTLSKAELDRYHIIFKKIPRDITRF